jgi:nifR3 family TIM-barrel protein
MRFTKPRLPIAVVDLHEVFCNHMSAAPRFSWTAAQKPIVALAPMAGVTDASYRQFIKSIAPETVVFTEFLSTDALAFGAKKTMAMMDFDAELERPFIVQVFGHDPDHFLKAAQIIEELGADGMDINMGCPDRSVEKGGAGAALIKNPSLASEIIEAAKRGAGETPISVKTRIGYNVDEIDTWIPQLLAHRPAALTVHLRTRKEMSEVPAHWEHMPRIAALRAELAPDTRLIGNGDVQNIADARAKVGAAGCDGAMLGRAIFGNPWLFSEYTPTPHERIAALTEHIQLFDELLGGTVNFATMKKHFKAYIHGWDHAKDVRVALMETTSASEALVVLAKNK